MKKIIPALLAMVLVLVFMLPAFGQEDIVELKDPAFTAPKRPAAVFKHDEHNELAQIDDCTPCHHEDVDEEGQFIEGDPDYKCADCHTVEKGNGTPLQLAYHKMCIDCHTEKKAGPVACGQCHVK